MSPTEHLSEKQRWTALYVLCVGMLMIVLDITVVNVALPSIQEDLGFTQSGLAWVVNGYLIAFGGLLLLSGRLGDLLGRRNLFLWGLVVFVLASMVCGFAQSQEVLVGARFVQGVGGADDLRRDPGHDRDDVPGAPGAGQGARRVRLRRIGWRLDRPPRRRRAHRVDQLALDLLHQRPDRDRHGHLGQPAARQGQGHRHQRRRGRSRRRAHHLRVDAWRLHDRQARGRGGLGRSTDAGAQRDLARPAGRVHRSRGDGTDPADAAADLPRAEHRRRQPGAGPGNCRDVWNVLPRIALPRAGQELHAAGDRLRVPARDARDGHDVDQGLRQARAPIRPEDGAGPGTWF